MADAPLKRTMVVLEDGLLASLAVNPVFTAEFPVLAPIAKLAKSPQRAGCGSCGRAGQARTSTYQQVKQALASMDSTKKRKLKDMLNAQSVRIIYKDSRNKAQQLTF